MLHGARGRIDEKGGIVIKRYEMAINSADHVIAVPDAGGEWVKFEDHEDALRKAVNAMILACAKFNDLVDQKAAS